MDHEIPLMAIVTLPVDGFGVVVAHSDSGEEYRVRPVTETHDSGDRIFTVGLDGLYNRDEICPFGFCQNDIMAPAILCAAAGEDVKGNSWATNNAV